MELREVEWAVFDARVDLWRDSLGQKGQVTVQLYLRRIQSLAYSQTRLEARARLWNKFLHLDCLIPIKQISGFKATERSLKQYLSLQQMGVRLYWQIVVRLAKLKLKCLEQLGRNSKIIVRQLIQLVSTYRIVLEENKETNFVSRMRQALSFVVDSECQKCTVAFNQKVRYISRKVEVDLQSVLTRERDRMQSILTSFVSPVVMSTVRADTNQTIETPTPPPQSEMTPDPILKQIASNKGVLKRQQSLQNNKTANPVGLDRRRSVIRTIHQKQSKFFVGNHRQSTRQSDINYGRELSSVIQQCQTQYYTDKKTNTKRMINISTFAQKQESVSKAQRKQSGDRGELLLCGQSPPRRKPT